MKCLTTCWACRATTERDREPGDFVYICPCGAWSRMRFMPTLGLWYPWDDLKERLEEMSDFFKKPKKEGKNERKN